MTLPGDCRGRSRPSIITFFECIVLLLPLVIHASGLSLTSHTNSPTAHLEQLTHSSLSSADHVSLTHLPNHQSALSSHLRKLGKVRRSLLHHRNLQAERKAFPGLFSLPVASAASPSTSGSLSPFKLNKQTVEMLNKGLHTLIGIKRLLTTIRSVNELSLQAFPALASKPRIGFIMKLINGGKLPLPAGSTAGSSSSTKRNPSLGLIKIGEKPPPGLFPETMPFSMSNNPGENTGNLPPPQTITGGIGISPSSSSSGSSLSSPSKSVTLSPIELFAQLGSAALAATSGSSGKLSSSSSGGKKKRPVIITKHNIHEFQNAGAGSGKPFFEGTYEVFQNPHLN